MLFAELVGRSHLGGGDAYAMLYLAPDAEMLSRAHTTKLEQHYNRYMAEPSNDSWERTLYELKQIQS